MTSEWKPIASAPKDGTPVLLYGALNGEINDFGNNSEIVVGAFRYNRWTMDNTDYYSVDCEPTHWMALPAAPGGPIEEAALAADEVEAAESNSQPDTSKILAENKRLREAATPFAELAKQFSHHAHEDSWTIYDIGARQKLVLGDLRRALAALNGEPD